MNRRILEDHRRRGKVLVAPFNYLIGPINDVSWIDIIIPEISWIGLVQRKYGHAVSVQVITSFTRTVRKVMGGTSTPILSAVSEYAVLDDKKWADIREAAAQDGSLFSIQKALDPLIALYPKCPLRHALINPPSCSTDQHVALMKNVIENLLNRSKRDPMMVQATAVWLAFDSGMLKVAKGISLSRFPEIENYPDTEDSLRVGAAVRQAVTIQFGPTKASEEATAWRRYFWARGIQVSPCEFYNE